MSEQLSEAVRQLIVKARIVSFAAWQSTYPSTIVARFQAADDEGRYLTDEDLQAIATQMPETAGSTAIARMLRDRVAEIVEEARANVLAQFPDITEPGGGLYPPLRAEACWRDFWHFLRCITYGIAGQQTAYTSEDGLYHMKLLYQELRVPLDAMVVGLEGIKTASLKRCPSEQAATLAPYFDHLIAQLDAFRG